ncbi:MAG: circadian clock protein KaiC [Desulfosalsimonas sp.]|uniref:circadian clock protein KaiC n=1 Tax=Desulfosalsimonas sp. TaxID=3073848 RepID=UPI00397049A3
MSNADEKKRTLEKTSSGIPGFEGITHGGIPHGRPTLVCGNAGCGKTLFGMQFLVAGATEQEEPGVFVAFEETESDLKTNVASLGWDLDTLCEQNKFAVETINISSEEMIEAGRYDLEGLFVRLDAAIREIGARRIVLDTVETLFGAFMDAHIVRAEFRRLLRWFKDRDITTVVTAERGSGGLTRFGIEEYVSDCVIELSQTVSGQTTRRHLRILKYRGSEHGTNAYPFLIGQRGIHLFPVTELGLDFPVSEKRISSGIHRLDEMLGGKGFYRGSSLLLSGTTGTGKSSISASFAAAACARGEQVLYISYEEARTQIIRNMKSIGIDLEKWYENGRLGFHTERVTTHGLEEHFFLVKEIIDINKPEVVVIDPVSNLLQMGSPEEVKNLLTRLIDLLKSQGITTLVTELITGGHPLESTSTEISSLMDAWLLLRDIESGGERNRLLHVLKSRGMAHSHQVREFILTDHGIELKDVYAGPAGLVTGTARYTQEAQEEEQRHRRIEEIERRKNELERKRKLKEARLKEIETQFQGEEEELLRAIREAEQEEEKFSKTGQQRKKMRGGS